METFHVPFYKSNKSKDNLNNARRSSGDHEVGQHIVDRPPNDESSTESIGSTQWKCRFRERLVPRNQIGHIIEPASFFLCLLAVLLLCGGTFMCATCFWAMLYRLPYCYLLNRSALVDSINFNLCGGLISIPCSWIAWTSQNTRRNYQLLPVLIIMLGFSLAMLSTGASLAIVNRSKMIFQDKTYPPELAPSSYESSLNESMHEAMNCYDKSINHRYAWNRIQYRLKCCGVRNWDDWKKHRKFIPISCFASSAHVYSRGCIHAVAFDIAWQMCLLTGFGFMLFGIQTLTLLFATYLYVKAKLSHRPNEEIEL